ncbi:Fibronectin-binding protein A N-terminus (FbpA) [Nakaseomyces glabratus]
MKQRISALDLQILAVELKSALEGFRLSNIYNIADSSRQFLLKFNKPDSKANVVVDCGLRIHLTEFNRPVPPTPSGFVVKLRKHLKSKRLTALRQVTGDRILVLEFADGLFYLVLEFFSAGNVILLDHERKILALQRIVHEHENKVGEVYNMFDETTFDENMNDTEDERERTYSLELVNSWMNECETKFKSELSILSQNESKNKKVKVMSIHKLLLSKVPHLSSDLLSKNLRIHGFNPSSSCLEYIGKKDEILNLLLETEKEYKNLLNADEKTGYIIAKKNPLYKIDTPGYDLEYIYENFHPFIPHIPATDEDKSKVIKIEGDYNKTLDDFFSTIESSKYALKIQNQEQQAKQKIEAARQENQKRIDALREQQASNETKGNLLIANFDLVEEVKSAVLGLVNQQMDWNTIEKLIQSEQNKGNKIAKHVSLPLDLKNNKIKILLPNTDEEDSTSSDDSDSDSSSDDDSEIDSSEEENSDVSDFETEEGVETSTKKDKKKVSQKRNSKVDKFSLNKTVVAIDLGLSAYANASTYFNMKKDHAEKQKKVEKNIEKAMKNIEDKIGKQLQKKLKESHDVLKKIRKPYFFEKYFWFYSTEGFLVMLGKSNVETDQIYSRYIEDDDIFMSNSFDTKVWIKNPERVEVPPNTLMQAGILCMSASPAWQKKIASSPWWCFAKNVTKFDDVDGSVLAPGVFRLRNEKQINMLPPAQLVMGVGFMWKKKTEENELENEQSETDTSESESEEISESKEIPSTNETAAEVDSLDNKTGTELTENSEETNMNITNASKQSSAASLKDIEGICDDESDNRSESVMSAEKEMSELTLSSKVKKQVRGKKGKLKKMQKKYADQDEDEKRIRLEALGTLKGVEKQKQREAEEKKKQELREHKKIRREKQKQLQALKFNKNEKVKVDYEKIRTELVPNLTKEEEISDIVPVFAPWPAMLKYKYKVKIQPGNAKKTKTLSEVLNYFKNREVDPTMSNKELDWPREHEYIKTMKEQEMVLMISVDKLKATLPSQGKNSSKSSKNGKTQKKKK